jgi:uncharacterized protein involved in exopolysaccharide biosynthesis
MNPEANRTLLIELADAVVKSWWTVVAGVCFGTAAAILVLSQIPKQYQATAKILVTPQQIPQEFVRSMVTEDMTRRMVVLEEMVVSDAYMRELVDRTIGTPATERELNWLIRDVRSRISVKPTAFSGTTIVAFDLSFMDSDRRRAAKVVNTLAELYIDQNTEFRANQANETTRTIEEQTLAAKLEYEAVDKALTEFKARHRFKTEEFLDTNLRRLEMAKRDLDNNLTTQAAIPEKIRVFKSQLTSLLTGESAAARIAQLEVEVEELLLRYSEVHPDVVKKRRQIEELKLTMASEEASGVPEAADEPSADPERAALEAQIHGLERELTDSRREEGELRRQIAEYEGWIRAVPEVQPELMRLESRRNNLYKRYQVLRRQLDQAEQSQYIEERLLGKGLELAERARVPKRPVVPKPIPAFVLGILGGCLLFVAPLLIRRFMSPLVSSEARLRTLTDVPVLVSIPRVLTPYYRGATVKRLTKNFVLSAVCVGALVAVITLAN